MPSANWLGADNMGPTPPAADSAHASSAADSAMSSGALYFSSARMASMPRSTIPICTRHGGTQTSLRACLVDLVAGVLNWLWRLAGCSGGDARGVVMVGVVTVVDLGGSETGFGRSPIGMCRDASWWRWNKGGVCDCVGWWWYWWRWDWGVCGVCACGGGDAGGDATTCIVAVMMCFIQMVWTRRRQAPSTIPAPCQGCRD
eukprot:354624-Chlamydomonas_euryale.AAC.2